MAADESLWEDITDASMKVTLPILQRVYLNLQERNEKRETGEDDILDPEDHILFISAYDMPLWHWSSTRSTFEKYWVQSNSDLFLIHSQTLY